MKKKTIFIQIAAYRDPELVPTLDNLLHNAKYKNRLKICIAWQNSKEDKWDNLDKFENNPNFNILDIPHLDSEGVCWARNKIQQEYRGEDFTLQLDSHHRFVKDWDVKLIEMFNSLVNDGYPKPLITAYIPSYVPDNDPAGRLDEIWKMEFDRYAVEGYIATKPHSVPDYKKLKKPIPSRFYSAHFAFTVGKFCLEVPHDPNMYFHGEEPSIAVRAYTNGYDLFHPHRIIAWHEYTRNDKAKQWDDVKEWNVKNDQSHERFRLLFGMDGVKCTPCALKKIKPYILGNKRTLEDYEKFSGIRYGNRSVQTYTLEYNLPPNPIIEDKEEYDTSFITTFKHCIDIHSSQLTHKDYDFWVVSFESTDGKEIVRLDAAQEEVDRLVGTLTNGNEWIKLWREYNGKKLNKYVVWPHSKSEGWVDRIEQVI
tara:strand:+ start:1581 stop:2852 length:1272 start_codon:yes stop_codon:yes gene_type:complete